MDSEQIKRIEDLEFENHALKITCNAWADSYKKQEKIIEQKDKEIGALKAMNHLQSCRIKELEDGLREAKEDDGFGWLHSSTREKIEQLLTK